MSEHRFAVSAVFPGAEKEGRVANPDGTFAAPFTSAPSLGGKGGATNPEELLLSAVGACFTATWAIFLAKLKIPLAEAALDAEGVVEPDPAGGFQFTGVTLRPRLPEELWASRRAELEKSLQLAEKYCIVSKAITRGVALHVALPE